MNNELYFIPIIADALRKPNQTAAFYEAFQRIMTDGQNEAFDAGYRQFLQFVARSFECWEAQPLETPSVLWPRANERGRACGIRLERGNQHVGGFDVDHVPFRTTIVDVRPGHYRLVTETSWQLWDATLTPRELYWTQAFPTQDFPLAAQTEDLIVKPTYETQLLDGALTIRAYPGLEGGRLEVVFDNRRPNG